MVEKRAGDGVDDGAGRPQHQFLFLNKNLPCRFQIGFVHIINQHKRVSLFIDVDGGCDFVDDINHRRYLYQTDDYCSD